VKAVIALGVAGAILAAAVVSMDLAGGPFHDVAGVVRSAGPGDGNVTVVLASGKVIQATVHHPGDAPPGQNVRVRVFHRFLSGGTSYEVMPMKEAATK
jgi:hypothetical protein